jgi:hypothetical protein
MRKPQQINRDIQFLGNSKNDSILIGNYGDASVTASGNFELAGTIFCRYSKVGFNLTGIGTARFKGICKELVIQRMEGNCVLDLSELSCRSVRCEFVKSGAIIILGHVRSIEIVSVDENTTLTYKGDPLIFNHPAFSSPTILKKVA